MQVKRHYARRQNCSPVVDMSLIRLNWLKMTPTYRLSRVKEPMKMKPTNLHNAHTHNMRAQHDNHHGSCVAFLHTSNYKRRPCRAACGSWCMSTLTCKLLRVAVLLPLVLPVCHTHYQACHT